MPFSKKSILVVDDDESVRDFLIVELKDCGFSVIEATDGKNAVELLTRGFVPDVILSDMRMPLLDGMSLLAFVAERYPLVPFVFLTGFVSDELLHEAMRLGAWDYLEKPYEMRDLETVLNKVLIRSERLRRLLPSA